MPHRPLENRTEPRVEFIAEQDGPAERELKAEFTTWMEGDSHVQRAYLAIVGFQPKEQRSVALCLVSTKPGDPALLNGVSAIFARLFNTDAHLDIVFLSAEQEEDLRRVCRAFYP